MAESKNSDPEVTHEQEAEQGEGSGPEVKSQRDRRSMIFHLLYAMEANDYQASLESIVNMFNREYGCNIEPDGEIVKTTQSIIDERTLLDDKIKPFLTNWRFERIGICTKLILRYALWELLNTDLSKTIIINEAIELAKCYAEKDAYKFVNGILDEFVKGTESEKQVTE